MNRKPWANSKCRATGVIILLLVFALPVSVRCEAPAKVDTLTLAEAVELALRNQPTVEMRTGQARASEARTGQARGAFYPRVTVGSAYTRIWPVGAQTTASTSNAGLPANSSFIPGATSREGASYEQYAATASLSQMIYDFGRTSSQVDASKLAAQAARLDLLNEREQVVLNVKEAYYRLVAANRNREVQAAAVDQFRNHLNHARSLFEVGAKPRFDVTKAEVDLSNAEVNLIRAENSVKLSVVALNNTMGIPDMGPYTVEEDTSPAREPMPFDEAVTVALNRRPDLVALQKQKESAAASVETARKDRLPTLSGSAALTYVGTSFPLDHGWTAGVNMTVPLFNGFVTSHRIEEARANAITANANERNLKQAVVMEVEQAYLTLSEAAQRMKSTGVAVKQARENVDLVNERYSAGLAIAAEVTDAVVSLATAEFNDIAARYDYRIARARIQKAVGGESR